MIDITQFCDPVSLRVEYQKPFDFGEFTVATNGHVIVAVPQREGFAGNPAQRVRLNEMLGFVVRKCLTCTD